MFLFLLGDNRRFYSTEPSLAGSVWSISLISFNCMVKKQLWLKCCLSYSLTNKLIFQSTSNFCKQDIGQFCRNFLNFQWNQILISISQVMGLQASDFCAKNEEGNIYFWIIQSDRQTNMQLVFNFQEISNQDVTPKINN